MPQARDEAGNIWEVDAQGNPVRLISQAGAPRGNVIDIPPDPMAVRRDTRAENADARASAAQERAARNEAARLEADRQKMAADLYQKGLRIGANGQPEPIPGWSPPLSATNSPRISAKERADAIAGYESGAALDRIVSQLETQFKTGPGATHGINGLWDYLPTTANQQFDKTGNAARGIVGSALGFTGGQLNTATEAEQAVGPYLPNSWDRDATILDKIARLRAVASDARKRSTAILGGVPDANGNVTPVPTRNPLNETFMGGIGSPAAAGAGATQGGVPIAQEYQDAHAAFIAKNLGSPTFADDYVKFRVENDQKYGFGSDVEGYRNFANTISKNMQGRTVNPTIPPVAKPLSAVDQFRNNLVSNPLGAGVAGVADAGGFGIPSMLAPQQMSALGDQNPTSMALGQVAGSIAGTSALGKAGGMGLDALARGAPRLANAARNASPFARSLATDAAYSGIYGANTGQDPLTSAGMGALGSAAGQGIGAGLGRAAAGATRSLPVRMLRNRGIPMTIGQQLGGFAKSAEDAMTSLPGVGDLVNARRLEGLRAFNQQAMNEAGQPVGARVSAIGEDGVAGLLDQIGNSYDQATAGVRVPLDAQFGSDLNDVAMAYRRLPPDYGARFAQAMDNRVGPVAQAGEMTGDTYQQAVRGIKGYRAGADRAAPGFEQDYRDAMTLAQDALTSQMQRGGGASVTEGLSRADQAYRMAKTLGAAVKAARNGSRSGEVQTFTPSQLVDAGTASQTKYGGKRPFAALADAGQRVLPSKLPDSGTAKRLMQAGIGAGGVGAAYGLGDAETAAKTAAVLGLLGIGGTKTGQRSLEKLLFDRPDVMKRLGRSVRKRKGLLGTATLPFMIENGN